MVEDKRHATGSGGGRLASEDRTGKVEPDVLNVRYGTERTSNPFKAEDPEKSWLASLSSLQLRKLIGGGVLALGVVSVMIWNILDRRDAQGAVVPVGHRPESTRSQPTLVDTASAEEIRLVAEATVREFMEATSDEERSSLVLGSEGVEERMKEYYGRPGSPAPSGFGAMKELKAAAFDGKALYWVEARDAAGGRDYFFNLVPLKDRMVIEWESSVAYCEMSWEQFMEERPTEARQMRVQVEGSNYYNHEFSDDKFYKAFTLTGHGLEGVINAYVERDSAAGRELAWVGRTPGAFRYNLRLQWLENSEAARSLKIVEVLHRQWADVSLLKK